jgi:hypothetical protein
MKQYKIYVSDRNSQYGSLAHVFITLDLLQI